MPPSRFEMDRAITSTVRISGFRCAWAILHLSGAVVDARQRTPFGLFAQATMSLRARPSREQ